MESFIYNVWFRDTAAHPEDQDRDWVACISIQAPTPEQAQEWGDTLARDRTQRVPADVFVNSTVEPERNASDSDLTTIPRISVGERPTDDTLGWLCPLSTQNGR